MTISLPSQFHELMSTPLWHNRYLETKFDHELSINGFNFIRDLFHGGILIKETSPNLPNLRPSKVKLLAKIGSKLDNNALNMISTNSDLEFAINPLKCIDQKNNNCFKWITQINSIDIYYLFYQQIA